MFVCGLAHKLTEIKKASSTTVELATLRSKLFHDAVELRHGTDLELIATVP
jgi:hypothetical protein